MKQNQIAQSRSEEESLSKCNICLKEINKIDRWNDKELP